MEILNYFRNRRKDAAEATLNFNAQLIEEQRDWRQVLRKEIDQLSDKLHIVQTENAVLLKRIAELEAHNEDLKRDNEELEARVKELERELRKHDPAAGVIGL